MVRNIRRYEACPVNPDPARGSEGRKMRPCVIISPDEMSRYVRAVMIAPMTSARRDCPSRVNVIFQRKKGRVVPDRAGTVDKSRLARRLASSRTRARDVADVPREMFACGS